MVLELPGSLFSFTEITEYIYLVYNRPSAFHLPTLGRRVETRGCFFISRVESRLLTLQMKKRVGESRLESLGREFA